MAKAPVAAWLAARLLRLSHCSHCWPHFEHAGPSSCRTARSNSASDTSEFSEAMPDASELITSASSDGAPSDSFRAIAFSMARRTSEGARGGGSRRTETMWPRFAMDRAIAAALGAGAGSDGRPSSAIATDCDSARFFVTVTHERQEEFNTPKLLVQDL